VSDAGTSPQEGEAAWCPAHGHRTQDGWRGGQCNAIVRKENGIPILCSQQVTAPPEDPGAQVVPSSPSSPQERLTARARELSDPAVEVAKQIFPVTIDPADRAALIVGFASLVAAEAAKQEQREGRL
jgi:hypothetical protein